MDYRRFYAEIGKLLYAVADIDKVIEPQEKQALLDIVNHELIPLTPDTDKYGTPLAHYVEIQFDFLDEQIWDSETAFESFIDYVSDHRTGIRPEMKAVCMKLVRRIAAAYAGTSRKEEQLINALRERLSKIEFGKPSDRKKRKRIPVREKVA